MLSDKAIKRIAQATKPTELYHVTFSGNLPSIAQGGLQPAASSGIGAESYDSHKQKGVFLTDQKGLQFWLSKSRDFADHYSDNPYESGHTPVTLLVQIPNPNLLTPDELGSQDTLSDAWIYPEPIPPENLFVWDGNDDPGWYEIDSFIDEPIDTSPAYDIEDYYDEDSQEETQLHWYKDDNPLIPKFDKK